MTIDEFKKRLWLKLAGFILLEIIIFYIILLIPPFCYTGFSDNPIKLFLSLFLMGLFSFFYMIYLMKVSSSSRRRMSGDYEREENRFEETSNQLILNTFGYEIFERIYTGGMDINMCKNLLQKEQSGKDPEVRFCLLVKLAICYAKDGQIRTAIQAFRDALSIKPEDLMANFRIATLYESIGSANDAVMHYKLVKKYNKLAGDFDDYLDNQIKRVMTEGPRERGPYDGSGLQWLS